MISPRNAPSDPLAQLSADAFHVCPLCESLNLAENQECFVCGWQGQFDDDPYLIEERLYDLLAECPEVLGLIGRAGRRPTLVGRVRDWFAGLFRRRLDLRA